MENKINQKNTYTKTHNEGLIRTNESKEVEGDVDLAELAAGWEYNEKAWLNIYINKHHKNEKVTFKNIS